MQRDEYERRLEAAAADLGIDLDPEDAMTRAERQLQEAAADLGIDLALPDEVHDA